MTMREADRLRDKIEVSLDGRQVFFLFFGGAVLACLVFLLGVMVGKKVGAGERLASRGAAVDPLAALDELGADERADDLAFPSALTGDRGAKERPLGAADVAPRLASAERRDPGKPILPTAGKPAPAVSPPVAPPAPIASAKVPLPASAAKGAETAKGKAKFTLQLSSFQDKAEADAFVGKLTTAGYRPYVVQSVVADKGTFYRVRLGQYQAQAEAVSAKGDFERRQRVIAYVTKL